MPAVSLRLTVAVRAKHAEVFEPVVVFYAVNVVDVRDQRLATPIGDSAFIATIVQKPRSNQPMLDIVAAFT